MWLPLSAVALLLATPLAMLIVRLARPRFAYFWLIAAFGGLLAWPLVLLSHPDQPLQIPLVTWKPEELLPVSPALLVDHISWPFALALASLALGVILTDVARAWEADWSVWAGSLAFTALGLFAVLAGNPLTLLLAWAAIDLIELVILLLEHVQSAVRERLALNFSSRVAGIVLVILAGILARSSGSSFSFETISPRINVLLLLAAGLRLGVVPLHLPFLSELPLRRGLGTLLRLVPTAASLVLLSRTAAAGVPENLAPYLLVFSALAALYGSISWATADHELDGRQFWILGMAAFVVASSVRGQPSASLAWGIALLLSGGLLFFFSARHRSLLVLPLLGLAGFSCLPFTPAWEGVRMYTPFTPLMFAFLISQGIFMAGYLRHALRPGLSLTGVERWVWAIYPAGLALLPLTQVLITWWGRAPEAVSGEIFPPLTASWPGLASLALAGLFIFLGRRGGSIPRSLVTAFRRVFSFGWLYRLLWSVYHSLARWIGWINLILEGEGGILWTLLLLALLFSLLAQRGL